MGLRGSSGEFATGEGALPEKNIKRRIKVTFVLEVRKDKPYYLDSQKSWNPGTRKEDRTLKKITKTCTLCI